MRIIHSRPPAIVWDRASTLLGANESTLFAYAPDIYVPGGGALDDFLIAHERTHLKQQGTDPDAWWERYFVDPLFRVEQEIAAYRNQLASFAKVHKDRNDRARFTRMIASDFAGPLYGRVITFNAAYTRIMTAI